MGDSMGLNRPAHLILATSLLLLLLAPAAFAAAGQTLTLTVYSDGYVSVMQVVPADPKATSVQVPLLSNEVSNLVATDQNGAPLSYGFGPGGTNLTVYTLGVTSVTLRYETNSLTGKNGTVWTLTYTAHYNATVVLPRLSTLISASGTPYSINETNMSPEVTFSPGTWKVSYGVPIGNVTTTVTTTTGGTPGGSPGQTSTEPVEMIEIAVVAAAIAVAGGLSFWWWRRRRGGPLGGDLRPDDVQVLSFIREKGGRALELEIRTKFALPKTSGWRQIKRLERLGYVKVTKAGSQNQIELLKERDAGN
jgi:uncharacterized membrane protein